MLLNVIVATDSSHGIGKNGTIPWYCPEDLRLFKRKTMNSILIVGRKTAISLPPLKDREIFCVSRTDPVHLSFNNVTRIFKTVDDAINVATVLGKEIFIAGGGQLYDYVFQYYKDAIRLHISRIKGSYVCDTYFDVDLQDFIIVSKETYENFDFCEMISTKHGEKQYIDLVQKIINQGERREGRNGLTISTFGEHLKFDLRQGFPLLTTKKMFTKGIIEELLFFLRGYTNSKLLEEQGINIWKGNTSRKFLDSIGKNNRTEGIMGNMYGAQWRHFNGKYNENTGISQEGVDQLQYVIDTIKNDPTSRRILMTDFNPSQVNSGVLYPCHSIILQFYVHQKYLDMFCYNRSNDIGLGLPFNIASSSLLLSIVAKITNLTPRFINISIGDAHIYESHIEPLREQILRRPYIFPNITIPDIKNLFDLDNLTYTDFILHNYQCHPKIKMEMSA